MKIMENIKIKIRISRVFWPSFFFNFMTHYIHIFIRHTLIDDSHETKITEKKRRNKPKLEDPVGTNGLGGLLRRLSKRDRDRGMVNFTKFSKKIFS